MNDPKGPKQQQEQPVQQPEDKSNRPGKQIPDKPCCEEEVAQTYMMGASLTGNDAAARLLVAKHGRADT